jgi:hypothetical protein
MVCYFRGNDGTIVLDLYQYLFRIVTAGTDFYFSVSLCTNSLNCIFEQIDDNLRDQIFIGINN